MTSRGRGRKGRPRGTGQAPPTFDLSLVFDQQAFAEAVVLQRLLSHRQALQVVREVLVTSKGL